MGWDGTGAGSLIAFEMDRWIAGWMNECMFEK